jgi:SAM-dependent methyltransferase
LFRFFSSCVLAYHHFEDPAEMTRVLVQRLKPKGRLLVIDFVDDAGLETLFGQGQGQEHSHGHIVAHKHGSFVLLLEGQTVGVCSVFHLGFSSEQMTEMFKSSGLQQIHVDVRIYLSIFSSIPRFL